MIKTAVQAAVLMVILDRLGFVGGEPWMEQFMDSLSVQATLLQTRAHGSWAQGLRDYRQFISRIETKG